MKRIEFFFDTVSPYAWLAFDRLPQALAGHSCVVSYEPVLFLANSDGTIARRLDTIFDETEVAEGLAALT